MTSKSNTVYAIGRNYQGEFGLANSSPLKEITRLKWSNQINITQIYNGYKFTIYRDDKDRFYAAGHNYYGSCLQDKSKGEKIEKLSLMNGLQNLKISKIFCNPVVGSCQSFIVTTDNNIYSFGRNDFSQLGIGSDENQYKICRNQWKYGNIKQIQCAYLYSIILSENGSVYSTDYSQYGGNAQQTRNRKGSKTWSHIKTLRNISRIATGGWHTLCCDTNGNVYSFGNNYRGQLGLNTTDNNDHIEPRLIPFFQQRHIIVIDVCCGSDHSLVLSQSGKVFAFGNNGEGQCGQGNGCRKADLPTPTQIQSFSNNNIKTIMCGTSHSAVITTNQIIFMFGLNKYNECIISSYNGEKDEPISINNFIQNKFKKQIVSIHLGYHTTTLILTTENNKIKKEEKEFKEEIKMDEINNNNNKNKKKQRERQLQKEKKEMQNKLKKEQEENKALKNRIKKMSKYNNDIIEQLVNLGVGSRDECIAASMLVINANDINEVSNKVLQLQNKKMDNNHDDEKVTEISSFEDQINQLLNIIKKHFKFMSKQEKTVNKMIDSSGQQRNKLKNAKIKALDTEKKLLTEIMNISSMNDFLTNIILIENLFNFQYNKQAKLKQTQARHKYAKNISFYEQKSKPICKTLSFIDLILQAYIDLTDFKDWLKILQNECSRKNMKILVKPEAKQKNIARAFYKTFYVYAIEFGDQGYQRLTDILRCSLVFDNFNDLYQCFAIIEQLTKENGGILRCKDRFNPSEIPFGYRDLLINIYCPQSKDVVCEVQLHHQLFYKHKIISHAMYKKARLFEDKNGNNLAYEYANKYIRDIVGNKQYEYDDEKEDALDPVLVQLFKEWNLSGHGYEKVLIDDEGYDDPLFWKDISVEELKEMGFKTGHAKKFVAKAVKL